MWHLKNGNTIAVSVSQCYQLGNMATGWSPTLPHSDRARWICVYPAYINSSKTLAEGRRIPKENCVENPNHQEIKDVLLDAGMNVIVENKLYSREKSKEIACQGRIRVQLKNDDGSVVNDNFPNRDSILSYIAGRIPKYRLTKPNRGHTDQPHHQQQSGTQGSSKGKGKKGRR